jgi:hypothetical protein
LSELAVPLLGLWEDFDIHCKDCLFHFIIISLKTGFITCQLFFVKSFLHPFDEVLVRWQHTAPSVCFSAAVERILL